MFIIIKWLVVVAVVSLLLGFILLVQMNRYLIADQELAEADAIVLMMGDALGRVPEAVDLYQDGYAEVIIMVQGAHETETTEAWTDALNLGVPEENIIVLPGQARSTWDEVVIVGNYLAGRTDINSLILVNSALQTRRTLLSFKRVLRKLDREILLISRASRYAKIDDESYYIGEPGREPWWQDMRAIRTTVIESVKYIYYCLFRY